MKKPTLEYEILYETDGTIQDLVTRTSILLCESGRSDLAREMSRRAASTMFDDRWAAVDIIREYVDIFIIREPTLYIGTTNPNHNVFTLLEKSYTWLTVSGQDNTANEMKERVLKSADYWEQMKIMGEYLHVEFRPEQLKGAKKPKIGIPDGCIDLWKVYDQAFQALTDSGQHAMAYSLANDFELLIQKDKYAAHDLLEQYVDIEYLPEKGKNAKTKVKGGDAR